MKGPQGRGGQKPDFEFAACTGAQTYDLLATQLEGNQLKSLTGDTTIATLSITGRFNKAMYSSHWANQYGGQRRSFQLHPQSMRLQISFCG